MADELLVAGIVRTLAEHAFPLDPGLADLAVRDAVRAYIYGASISEACRVGQLCIAGPHPLATMPSITTRLAGPLADKVA